MSQIEYDDADFIQIHVNYNETISRIVNRYEIIATFLLSEISSSLPGFRVTVSGADGPYVHLSTMVGLGKLGTEPQSGSKGANQLFCQIEEFGREKS